MYPTLDDKDIMILNKIGYEVNGLERFDIVVVKYYDKYLIKRVIGLPGDNIKYKDNKLYINDKEVKLDMKFHNTNDFVSETKDNEYFVLGDNREVSKDSRILGNFTKDKIIGKVNIRFYPLDKIGKVK